MGLLLGLLAPGCVIEGEPRRPVRGLIPQRVVVAPVLAEPGSLVEFAMPRAMAAALRSQGYPVIDADAGIRELVEASPELARIAAGVRPDGTFVEESPAGATASEGPGLDGTPVGESQDRSLAEIGDLLGVDAVARARILVWRPRYRGDRFMGLQYQVRWSLVSVRNGHEIWKHQTEGNWQRSGRVGASRGTSTPWDVDNPNGTGFPDMVRAPVVPILGAEPASEAELIQQIAGAAYRGLR